MGLLYDAAAADDAATVARLLGDGSDPNETGPDGRAALWSAGMRSGATDGRESARLLLAAGARCDDAMLSDMARRGAAGPVGEVLVATSCPADRRSRAALVVREAALRLQISVLREALLHVRSVREAVRQDVPASGGRTLLHAVAAMPYATEAVVELLRCGADLHAVDRSGKAAEDVAWRGNEAVLAEWAAGMHPLQRRRAAAERELLGSRRDFPTDVARVCGAYVHL